MRYSVGVHDSYCDLSIMGIPASHNSSIALRPFFALLWACCLGVLAACSSTGTVSNWPEPLPARSHFVEQYQQDTVNRRVQSQEDYLTWVVRFYEGSLMVPQGWHDLTRDLADDYPASDARLLTLKRRELGMLIAAEWAKNNDVREIDTQMLTLWGSVMQQELQPHTRLAALNQILGDVQAILNGRLPPDAVTRSRYEEKLGISLKDDWDF